MQKAGNKNVNSHISKYDGDKKDERANLRDSQWLNLGQLKQYQ